MKLSVLRNLSIACALVYFAGAFIQMDLGWLSDLEIEDRITIVVLTPFYFAAIALFTSFLSDL